MKKCKFCEAMRRNKQVYDVSKSWATENEQYGKYLVEYTVAIVRRNWYQKKGKRSAARTVQFRYRGLGFELNYCPECGRKVGNE